MKQITGISILRTTLTLTFFTSNLLDLVFTTAAKPRSAVIDILRWGKVQGYQDQLAGRNISVYLGIPYAQPPVGKLRFAENSVVNCTRETTRALQRISRAVWDLQTGYYPVCMKWSYNKGKYCPNSNQISKLTICASRAPVTTPEPWTGVRNAQEFGASCPQGKNSLLDKLNITEELKSINFTAPPVKEDCLYLDIYTPMNSSKSSVLDPGLPVMFWIHGGGFVRGNGAGYDGGMLASKHNVVFVAINYRLGILGFFHIPGTDVKGNYGMLDQVGAMKWVKQNIRQFGGDPSKITILGESAGAVAVVLHLLSPMTKGLFTRVISESGTACSRFSSKPQHDTDAKKFLKMAGCDNKEPPLDCMRKLSVKDILKYQKEYLSTSVQDTLTRPVVDGQFLKEDITKMIKEKDFQKKDSVPYMLGFNLNEGRMFTPSIENKMNFEAFLKRYSLRFRHPDIIEAALDFEYTNWKLSDKDPLRWYASAADFQGDRMFKICTVDFANAWSDAGGSAYVYKLVYRPMHLRLPLWGVTHGTDLDYVFGKAYYPANHIGHVGFIVNSRLGYTEEDKKVTKPVMDMWTNFAKTGDPGKSWPKYTTTKKEFMNINFNMTVEKDPIDPKRMAFWDVLIPELDKTSENELDCK